MKNKARMPVKPVDLNKLARDITLAEGGKVNQSVAQIKETLRIALDLLAEFPRSEVLRLLEARDD